MSSYLIEITTNLGVTRLTTSQVDVDYLGNTYSAGKIEKVGKLKQVPSIDSSAMKLAFSGVSGSIISLFGNEDWRDRECRILSCDIGQDWSVSNVSEYLSANMVEVDYKVGLEQSLVFLTVKVLDGVINQSNSPKLGVLFDIYINEDKTVYFGKVGPVNGRSGGKPGGQIDFEIVEP